MLCWKGNPFDHSEIERKIGAFNRGIKGRIVSRSNNLQEVYTVESCRFWIIVLIFLCQNVFVVNVVEKLHRLACNSTYIILLSLTRSLRSLNAAFVL